jgi:hypothetical protein
MTSIKLGFCVAYDWELLRYSLPSVYDHADSICLSYDINNKSWAGEIFNFNKQPFLTFIESIDVQKKIKLLSTDFSLPELSPMQNEVRQRNRMAEFLGQSGWHLQLDCDEYFLDFSGFCKYLRGLSVAPHTNINCIWLTLFKQVENGFLIIAPQKSRDIETIPIATVQPHYEYGRRNGYFNHQTNFVLLHQSWARSESEIFQKINHWGHKNDFNASQFMELWRGINGANYKQFKNFHPIVPNQWPALEFVAAPDIETCIQAISHLNLKKISGMELLMRNSRVFSKIKSFLR